MKKLALLFALFALAACAAPLAGAPVNPTPISGYVTDLPAFEQFIASQPTPEQFRVRYPDVTLVLPGDIATKEMRMNQSRYFAQLSAAGRITGGRFQ